MRRKSRSGATLDRNRRPTSEAASAARDPLAYSRLQQSLESSAHKSYRGMMVA